MSHTDYKTLLGFTDRWFSLGIMIEDKLRQFANAYEASDDKSAEHYRYGAFLWYLQEHRPLSASIAEALYELGDSDPDISMGGAIMADILRLPECPPSVSAKALASDRKHLVRIATRQGLFSELKESNLTEEVFRRCMEFGDSPVQRFLLDRINLSPQQLQILAERGANRAVRNVAMSKLRSRNTRQLLSVQAGREP